MTRRHGAYASAREAILATAASLFTRQGVHGTSLGDVAAEAGMSKGTLYYYYPAKEELVLTIAGDCLDKLTDILLSWVDGLDRGEELKPALARLFAAMTEDGHCARLYTVLCAECTTDSPALRELFAARQQKWRVMLEVGTLKLRPRAAEVVSGKSELFFMLLSGYLMQTLGGMGAPPIDALMDALE